MNNSEKKIELIKWLIQEENEEAIHQVSEVREKYNSQKELENDEKIKSKFLKLEKDVQDFSFNQSGTKSNFSFDYDFEKEVADGISGEALKVELAKRKNSWKK